MPHLDKTTLLRQSTELASAAVQLPDVEVDPLPGTPPLNNAAVYSPRTRSLWSSLLLGVATVGLLGATGWFVLRGAVGERMHSNWRHVNVAEQASLSSDNHSLVLLGDRGEALVVEEVEVGEVDLDRRTTRAVRASHRRGNPEAAHKALRSAQADAVTEFAAVGAIAELLKDDTQVCRIELWDCCDNDGDAVDVLVNGVAYLTVPLTNESVSVAVPLKPGPNRVSLRGAQDGRGGVTVGIKTSGGEYINRKLRVGREYELQVVTP